MVGSHVKLSSDYKSVSDAGEGPLGESDVGEVLSTGNRLKVKALTGAKKDREWWYEKDAVQCASAEFIASAKAQGAGSQ